MFSIIRLSLVLIVITFFGCRKNVSVENVQVKISTDSIPRLMKTVLADLPDSLQPKRVSFRDVEPPITYTTPIPGYSKIFFDSVTNQAIPEYAQGVGMFTNYNQEDGLPYDDIHCGLADSDGNIWIGTQGGGVSKFDGMGFTNYNMDNGLAHNIVWDIMEDRKGNIWFGTFGGISKFNGHFFKNYTMENGMPYNDVGAIVEDQHENIWATVLGNGIVRIKDDSVQHFTIDNGLPTNQVWSISIDSKGVLWFGSREGFIFYANPADVKNLKFTLFEEIDTKNKGPVFFMYEDKRYRQWFGTSAGGVYCYDGKTILNYSFGTGLHCTGVQDMMEDQNGDYWFATCHGLTRLTDSLFIHYGLDQGLHDGAIRPVLSDRDGGIWIGSSGKGIFHYNGQAFTNYPDKDNPTWIYYGFESPNQQLWYYGDAGITLRDSVGIREFNVENNFTHSVTHLEQIDENEFWYCAYYGQGAIHMKLDWDNSKAILTKYHVKQGLPHPNVYTIREDKENNIWMSTYGGGLVKMDSNSFTIFTTKQGLLSNEVVNIYYDTDERLWLSYIGPMGLTMFDGKAIYNFTTEHGLLDNGVEQFAQDDEGNFWFGSSKGINIMRKKTLAALIHGEDVDIPWFEKYDKSNGLPHNNIYHLTFDSLRGNMVVYDQSGLTILKGGDKAFSNNNLIEHYSTDTGYPVRGAFAAILDREGVFHFETSSPKTGFVRFDPNALRKNQNPPQVSIKKIQINNKDINWYSIIGNKMQIDSIQNEHAILTEDQKLFGTTITKRVRDSLTNVFAQVTFDSLSGFDAVPYNLRLPYELNNITIHFNANVLYRHAQLKYQYFLEGYDKNWSLLSDKSFASFGNIPEGKYAFHVKALSPDKVWSDTLTYNFTVTPPMHRTWWAYSVYTFLFGFFLITGQRYQKNKAIKAEQEKSRQQQAVLNERLRISRDLHDEVGATLSGISMYSHIAREQFMHNNKEAVLSSLDVMSNSAGQMVSKLGDIVWLLKGDEGDLNHLIEKLDDYARQMAQAKNIEVVTDFQALDNSIELTTETRRNIYLILKEAINNAIKYSEAEQIRLGAHVNEQILTLTLIDNGKGFVENEIIRGNGLQNMRKRAEELGAIFNLQSRVNRGTHLTLKIDLK